MSDSHPIEKRVKTVASASGRELSLSFVTMGLGLTQLTGDEPVIYAAAVTGIFGIAAFTHAFYRTARVWSSLSKNSLRLLRDEAVFGLGLGATAYATLEAILDEPLAIIPVVIGAPVSLYFRNKIRSSNYNN